MRPARMANLITASLWIVGALLCSFQSGWAVQRSLPTATLRKGATNDPVGAPIGVIGRTFPAETRSSANLLLDSSLGKFLSGSGRNALELVAAPPRAIASLVAGHELASVDALQLAPGNVRVNDPNQDPFAADDITTQSETAVAAYASGLGTTVLVGFNDSGEYLTRNSFMGYSRSTDGGSTFTDMGVLPPGPTEVNLGDPGLVVDRQGNFYASSIDFDFSLVGPVPYRVGIQKSTDGGLSWSGPVYAPPFTPTSFTDKDFIAVDNSGAPTTGNVYVTWTDFDFTSSSELPIVVSRSTDGGASFLPPVKVSDAGTFNQGSEPAVGPHGEVYLAWFQLQGTSGPHTGTGIVVAKSIDGGVSFGTPVFVTEALPLGFASGSLLGNFRTNAFPRIDVNPLNGDVYIVYGSNPPGRDAADVFFTRSTDGGDHWSPPIRVNDDHTNADQWFADLAVNQDGNLRVFWYDRRRHSNKPDDVLIDVFGTSSLDGGLSFSENKRISHGRGEANAGMLPAVGYDPVVNAIYMGDYNDIKVNITPDGPGRNFYSAWGDFTRLVTTEGGTRPDQDVVFARQSVSDHDAQPEAGNVGARVTNAPRDSRGSVTVGALGAKGLAPEPLAVRILPNPAGRDVVFGYSLPTGDRVRLSIFDLAGRMVARPVDESVAPGLHELRWDARAAGMSPQVYAYRLEALGRVVTGRFIVR